MITFKQFLAEIYKPKEIGAFVQYINNYERNTNWIPSSPLRYDGRVRTLFARHGFKPLGRGHYGKVFGSDSYQYTIKVWSDRDSGYNNYLRFCLKNQNNPYVPKIKGRPTKIANTGYNFIRLERLYPISTDKFNQFLRHTYSKVLEGTLIDKDLKVLIDFINTFEDDDLHSGNVMARSNGQIVITDPLAG